MARSRVGAAAAFLAALFGAPVAARAEDALPTFEDVTAASGIDFRNRPSKTSEKYLIESMVGGVALIDYDGDGDLDVYFVNGAALQDPMPAGAAPDKSDPRYWNRLYRNDGDFRFTDITEEAGVRDRFYGQGVAVGDYDGDGRPDLYVLNYGRNTLFRNVDGERFEDVTDAAGVGAGGWSAGAAFLDYDGDGLLDLFVSRYVKWSFADNPYCGERGPGGRAYCHPDLFEPIDHKLYRNSGDGKFVDVSRSAGVAASPGKGLGVAIEDFDGDGLVDVFVANDSHPQQLFRNNGDGTYEESALISGAGYDEDGKTFAGMGAAFADYDNDGRPDIFVNALAHQGYALFRNIGGLFEYVSGSTNVSTISALRSGWGTAFVDFDNDGLKDVFVAQGHVMDNIEKTQPGVSYEDPLLMMRNQGERFVDVSDRLGEAFTRPRAARGAALGDLDDDGFIDIVVNCNDQPAVVLRNSGSAARWLMVKLIDREGARGAIGARVRVTDESGREQYRMATPAGSYLSSNDPRLHFGLGSAERVAELEVTWPDGVKQSLQDVPTNRLATVERR